MKKIILYLVLLFSIPCFNTFSVYSAPQTCDVNSPCYYSGPCTVKYKSGATYENLVRIEVKNDTFGRKIAIITKSQVDGVNVGYATYFYPCNETINNKPYNYCFDVAGVTIYFYGRF